MLSSGQQDNGKGLSRTQVDKYLNKNRLFVLIALLQLFVYLSVSVTQVFQHPHEVLSGRTSSITRHRIFFDHNGRVSLLLCIHIPPLRMVVSANAVIIAVCVGVE